MICDLFSGFFALEGIWCVFAFRLSAFVEVTIWKVCVVRFNDEMIYDHDQDSYDKKSHLAPGHFLFHVKSKSGKLRTKLRAIAAKDIFVSFSYSFLSMRGLAFITNVNMIANL